MSFLVYYYYCCYLGVVTWGKKTKNKKPNKKKISMFNVDSGVHLRLAGQQ